MSKFTKKETPESETTVTEPEMKMPVVYIFRSKEDFQLNVGGSKTVLMADGQGGVRKLPDPNAKTIKCPFDNKTFVLTEAFAKQYEMTADEVLAKMKACSGWNRTFTLSRTADKLPDMPLPGPGVKNSG